LPLLEPRIYQTHSLRTFWSMLIPWPKLSFALYLITALSVFAMTIALWRRRSVSLNVRFSALLFATVLIAPHLTVYDLVIVAPALLLLSDWLISVAPRRTPQIATALYCVYMFPIIGPLAKWTHVQLTVIAMSALVFFLFRREAD
jgi:hypothetical protein